MSSSVDGTSERAGALVLIDGVPYAPSEARVSVYDRGFLYGDAVFETVRTYGGVPFALAEHLARLRRSAALVFITIPIGDDILTEEVDRAIRAAANPESYLRIMVTRGAGPLGLDPDLAKDPLRVIFVESLRVPPRETYARGIEASLVATRRVADATDAPGAKLANYLPNLLALRRAKTQGAAEALIVDVHGRIVEGASSNVFVVKGGMLVTPPESSGLLPGITRARVLDLARGLGVRAEERSLVPEEFYGADEAFITSSIREIVPLVRVDGRAVGSGLPGRVTRTIHRAFRVHVGAAGPVPWE